jgi:hypothetical protein
MYTQDINELTISGHVNQAPRLDDDTDVIAVCRFVLTHTTHAIDRRRPGWEQQHYNVTAYDTQSRLRLSASPGPGLTLRTTCSLGMRWR